MPSSVHIRCTACAKPIGHLFKQYQLLTYPLPESNVNQPEPVANDRPYKLDDLSALEKLGVRRNCCKLELRNFVDYQAKYDSYPTHMYKTEPGPYTLAPTTSYNHQ